MWTHVYMGDRPHIAYGGRCVVSHLSVHQEGREARRHYYSECDDYTRNHGAVLIIRVMMDRFRTEGMHPNNT